MKIRNLFVLIILILFSSIYVVSAIYIPPNLPTNINACTVIDSPGSYILTQDITDSNATECIEIISDDVVLNGNGHTIDGTGSGYGVYVHDVSNVIVKNFEVSDWDKGVFYQNSSYGVIDNITAKSNNGGVEITGNNGPNSYSSIINSNIVNNTGVGISLTFEDNILIDGNLIENNSYSGISLYYSYNNTISNNTIVHNNQEYSYSHAGLYLYYSPNNTITGNYISKNPRYGVYIIKSSYNALSENDIVFNCGGNAGVSISKGFSNIFESNNISFNTGTGIELWNSNNNTFLNNIVDSNGYHGTYLFYSDYNYLNNNSINNNGGYGLYLEHSANNDMFNNSVNGNQQSGFYLFVSDGANIVNNTANNNNYGILLSRSGNVEITGNTVKGNDAYGVYLSRSSGNLVYNNYFSNSNNVGLYSSYSTWNISKTSGQNIVGGLYLGGNYWANPDGTGFSQTCDDTDNDGICDLPYNITATNIDYLPLVMIKQQQKHRTKSFMIPGSYFRAEQIGLRQRVEINSSALFYIWIKNFDDEPLNVSIDAELSSLTPGNVSVNVVPELTLVPMEEVTVPLNATPSETGSYIITVDVYSSDTPSLHYSFVFVVDSY